MNRLTFRLVQVAEQTTLLPFSDSFFDMIKINLRLQIQSLQIPVHKSTYDFLYENINYTFSGWSKMFSLYIEQILVLLGFEVLLFSEK